ncbi:hypothetical protein [Succinimonas sp.]|uniref:hypothetical protein n=1 Tax=Succinimonas sp. TaxID=1936151 RepID=UPI00386CE57D
MTNLIIFKPYKGINNMNYSTYIIIFVTEEKTISLLLISEVCSYKVADTIPAKVTSKNDNQSTSTPKTWKNSLNSISRLAETLYKHIVPVWTVYHMFCEFLQFLTSLF